MMGFERVKEQIDGQSVIITSWYDADKQTWRASAPEYIHLLHRWSGASLTGTSRQEAIKRIKAALATCFKQGSQ